jgi:hypothetical protein
VCVWIVPFAGGAITHPRRYRAVALTDSNSSVVDPAPARCLAVSLLLASNVGGAAPKAKARRWSRPQPNAEEGAAGDTHPARRTDGSHPQRDGEPRSSISRRTMDRRGSDQSARAHGGPDCPTRKPSQSTDRCATRSQQ